MLLQDVTGLFMTRIREYVYELTHNDELITSIVPIGDGITLSVKK